MLKEDGDLRAAITQFQLTANRACITQGTMRKPRPKTTTTNGRGESVKQMDHLTRGAGKIIEHRFHFNKKSCRDMGGARVPRVSTRIEITTIKNCYRIWDIATRYFVGFGVLNSDHFTRDLVGLGL